MQPIVTLDCQSWGGENEKNAAKSSFGAKALPAADQIGRNVMIKVLSLLTRKDGISHEQFVRHWYDIHGPLALAVPGIRRYVQSHITDSLTRSDIPETDVAVDGIAGLWYYDLESFPRA